MGVKLNQDFDWISMLSKSPRNLKKLVQVIFDFVSLAILFLLSIRLVVGTLSEKNTLLFGSIFVFVSLVGFRFAGIYKTVIRFAGIRLLELTTLVLFISTSFLALWDKLFFDSELDLALLLLLFLLSVFTLAGARLVVREIIYHSRSVSNHLLIYGAGKAGVQLLTSIRQDVNYDVIGFIDDSEHLHGSQLHGLKVFPSWKLEEIVSKKKVSMVALAMPRASVDELRPILDKLEPLSVIVKTVPNISDLLGSKASYGGLEDLRIEELLGRERVSPNEELMMENIHNKVVMITGAGGSIGSELSRQVVVRSPKKLILVELSELALYNIQQELEPNWGHLVLPILGSVCDFSLIQSVMIQERVQIIYHAAAYKHVPLVEDNPFAAIHNNVFGTQTILEAAVEAGASSFTLVSTDKAVRPTNVMGASKRLAEIFCQLSHANDRGKTKIAMVRFGNVIGSSGSAIPKFREQIKAGGPVTVTHPDITRYFMSISEAVELVLQASSLAKGGEVFVLDMGVPIKILDLVQKLIRFSGNVVGNLDSPNSGAINIEYTGLRPGEKLYEELLISGDAKSTGHPKIKKINELHPEKEAYKKFIEELTVLCAKRDEVALRKLLASQDIGYVMDSDILVETDEATINPENVTLVNISEPLGDKSGENLLLNNYREQNVLNEKLEKIESEDKISIKKNMLFSQLFSRILHFYFLLVRPMTLGVRIIVRNQNEEILLVKHTYAPNWYLPGGGVDVGESITAAVKRELLEEVGIKKVSQLRLINILHNRKVSRRDHVVVFEAKILRQHTNSHKNFEISEKKYFKVDDIPDDIDYMSLNSINSYYQ